MSSPSDKFCLRWNDFESNISAAFKELRDDKDFFDVTLACDDDQLLAHKVILSACSPFFKTVLRRNRHQHPLLYLKGVKYQQLVAVLNFMYHGEVNVAQEELNSFLAVAEELKVKGLTQNGSSSSSKSNNSTPPSASFHRPAPPSPQQPASKRPRSSPTSSGDLQIAPIKCEPVVPPANSNPEASDAVNPSMYMEDYTGYEEGYDDTSEEVTYDDSAIVHGAQLADGNKDVDKLLEPFMVKVLDSNNQHVWKCLECGKISKYITNLKGHVEANHFEGLQFNCGLCPKVFKSRGSLRNHISNIHKEKHGPDPFPL